MGEIAFGVVGVVGVAFQVSRCHPHILIEYYASSEVDPNTSKPDRKPEVISGGIQYGDFEARDSGKSSERYLASQRCKSIILFRVRIERA